MDRFQFWLYVIVAVIYFLSRARKKAARKQAPKQAPRPENRPVPRQPRTVPPTASTTRPPAPQQRPSTPRKAVTFEDLLREITEAKEARKSPAPATPSYTDYDDDPKEEAQDLEDTEFDYRKTDQTIATYEEAKKQAFMRPSLENQEQDRERPMFGRYGAFEESAESGILAEYVADLNDPEGFKKALILNELINRRHF